MKQKSRTAIRRLADTIEKPSSRSVDKHLFCIVSWHREGRELSFYGNGRFGAGDNAVFFETRKNARIVLQDIPKNSHVDKIAGFLEPNVMDVNAYNEKYGKSIGPKPVVLNTTGKVDRKTGLYVVSRPNVARNH